MKTQSRIERDQLFLDVAALFGQRSTCPRAQVGAVAVQDGRIVASGYNGAPAGMPHCTEVGCNVLVEWDPPKFPEGHDPADIPPPPENVKSHCTRAVHAEANVIAWSARTGVALKGSEMYLTHTPCSTCTKLIINSGIKSVHFGNNYGHDGGLKLLYAGGVLVFLPKTV